MNTQTKLIANLIIQPGFAALLATFTAAAYVPQIPLLVTIIAGLFIDASLLLAGFQVHFESGYQIGNHRIARACKIETVLANAH